MRDEATTVDIGPVNLEGEGDIDRPADARGGAVAPAAGATSIVAGGDGRVPSEGPRPHIRVIHGLRRPANWLQLIRFTIVGASGYLVNLAIYYVEVHQLGIEYRVAAAIAWMLAALNNFVWNRHWTFSARDGQIHVQATALPAREPRRPRFQPDRPDSARRRCRRGEVRRTGDRAGRLDAAELPRQQALELPGGPIL